MQRTITEAHVQYLEQEPWPQIKLLSIIIMLGNKVQQAIAGALGKTLLIRAVRSGIILTLTQDGIILILVQDSGVTPQAIGEEECAAVASLMEAALAEVAVEAMLAVEVMEDDKQFPIRLSI